MHMEEVDVLIQEYLQKSVNIHSATWYLTLLNSAHPRPWLRPNFPNDWVRFRFIENPTGSTAFITDTNYQTRDDTTNGSTLQEIAQQFQDATGQSPTNMMVTTSGGVTFIFFPLNGPGRWESVWVCNLGDSLFTLGNKINDHKRGKVEVNVRLDVPPITRNFTVRRGVEDFNSDNKTIEAILEYRDKIISNVNYVFEYKQVHQHLHLDGFMGVWVLRTDIIWFPLLRTNKSGSLSQRRRGRSKKRKPRSRRIRKR